MRDALGQPDACGIVIGGVAGVGKTRLVADLLEDLGADVEVVRLGATESLASIPLGVVAHLLPSLAADPTADALARAAVALIERAGARRLVVSVDDAHLLDAASAALVHDLATVHGAFAIVTTRTGTVTPDAIRALWKDAGAIYVELLPLSDDDIAALIERALGAQVGQVARHRLVAAADGNPLLLREIIEGSLASGSLQCLGGVWMLTGPLGTGGRLRELVAARLADIGEAERRVLELLAIGEPLGAWLLSDLAPTSVLADLERMALIAVDRDGRRTEVRLAHPVYGEVLRESAGVLVGQARRRELADAVDARGALRRDDLLRVAAWRLEGGGDVEPNRFLEAARLAVVRRDHVLGERLARAAADAGAGPDALIELAEALYWQDRPNEAIAVLESVLQQPVTEAQRVRATIMQGSCLVWGLHRCDEATALLQSVGAPEADGHRALVQLLSGDVHGAHATAEAVLADPASDMRARTRAHGARVQALALGGSPVTAAAEAGAPLGDAIALVDVDPTLPGGILMGQFLGLMLSGDANGYDGLASALYESTAENDGDQFRGLWAFVAGRGALLRGAVDRAWALLREAMVTLEHGDVGRVLPWCFGVAAQCAGQRGDADGARWCIEAADARQGALVVWQSEIEVGRAWALVAAGERSSAVKALQAAADVAHASDHRSVEVLLLHEIVRLGGHELARAGLEALAGDVEGALADAARRQAIAVAGGDGAALDALADEWDARGAHLLAAECAAQAVAAHGAAGLTGSRAFSRARAFGLLHQCPGASTPALAGLDAAPELGVLTARELEVAGLAARGLTRKDIAARLYLSDRTVGNHLNHIYAKLGITNRDELASLLLQPAD